LTHLFSKPMNDFLFGASRAIQQTDLKQLILAVLFTIILTEILSWHYIHFAQVLSNKRKLARVFVVIGTTTLLMITIIGSSLVLSLGLVGALSIVRFRTPIKEPEELGYLFLSIGIGIGMGAHQALVTMVVFAIILVFITLRHYTSLSGSRMRTIVQVSVPIGTGKRDASGKSELDILMPAVEAACDKVDLRRVDRQQDEFNASLLVEIKDTKAIAVLLSGVETALPGANVSLIERDTHT